MTAMSKTHDRVRLSNLRFSKFSIANCTPPFFRKILLSSFTKIHLSVTVSPRQVLFLQHQKNMNVFTSHSKKEWQTDLESSKTVILGHQDTLGGLSRGGVVRHIVEEWEGGKVQCVYACYGRRSMPYVFLISESNFVSNRFFYSIFSFVLLSSFPPAMGLRCCVRLWVGWPCMKEGGVKKNSLSFYTTFIHFLAKPTTVLTNTAS
jgi:hypothetical protein